MSESTVSPREARKRRACYLMAMGHSTADIAATMKTTPKAVLHLVKSGEGPELVREFQESQESQLVEVSAAGDHLGRLHGLGPRVVEGFYRLIEKSERGELTAGAELKVLGDIADRIGIPRQTAQTVRHQHDRPMVNRETLKEIAALGAAMLSNGVLSGLDFRALGKMLSDESGDVVDVESESEPEAALPVHGGA